MAGCPMGDYYVTVCDQCLTASCWHGVFMCQESKDAGTKKLLASELLRLGLESPDYFSHETLLRVCGEVHEKTKAADSA